MVAGLTNQGTDIIPSTETEPETGIEPLNIGCVDLLLLSGQWISMFVKCVFCDKYCFKL